MFSIKASRYEEPRVKIIPVQIHKRANHLHEVIPTGIRS